MMTQNTDGCGNAAVATNQYCGLALVLVLVFMLAFVGVGTGIGVSAGNGIVLVLTGEVNAFTFELS